MAGTSWFSFSPNTRIRSSEVNANFDWLEGNLVPMSNGTEADSAYDLGTSSYKWDNAYINNVMAINGINFDTAASSAPERIYASGHTLAFVANDTQTTYIDTGGLHVTTATIAHIAGTYISAQTISVTHIDGTYISAQTISAADILADDGFFVYRGSCTAYDYQLADLTIGAWTDLTLSSIVSTNAKTVLLRVLFANNASTSYIQFRRNGQSNEYDLARLYTQVVSKTMAGDLWVTMDSNYTIEYYLATGTSSISITVGGWLK